MAHYKLTPEAEDDLYRIWRYGVLHYGESRADEYYYAFITCFQTLAEQPYLYASIDAIRKGYRRCVCGVDSIYYRINDEGVEIMRVIGQQDRDELL